MGPGVGGEGGEALGGFYVGGVVVAHYCAVVGEEAVGGKGGGGVSFCWIFSIPFFGGEKRGSGLGSGVGMREKQKKGGKGGGGVIYAKWEAFSSTFADRRSFMAAALSMMVLGLSN